MATRPHIADAWRVDVSMNFAGNFAAQWGFSVIKGSASFDTAAVEDLRDLVSSSITGNSVDDAIGIAWTFVALAVTSFDQPTRAVISVPMSITGGEGGQDLPFNVSAITSFRTDLAGPAHRGRSYMPGYTEASSNANTFDATSAGHLADMWADIVTGLAGIGVADMGVMSIAHTSITPVTSIRVEGTWATQRRRLDRARS